MGETASIRKPSWMEPLLPQLLLSRLPEERRPGSL
jgi:hypothetical protein